MGGKAAEVLKFGEENVTSGAAGDIKHVTQLARSMVTQFGMSDKLGNIDYANENQSYLGAWQGQSSHAGSTQQIIDEEVRRLVDEGYVTAKQILTENAEGFERLARGLLEYETLTGDEIRKVIAGEPLDRSDDAGLPPVLPGGGHSAIPKAGKPRRPDPDPDPGTGTGGLEPQPQ
jgi:cell division protease FtsH